MESVANHGPKVVISNPGDWEALYRPLPFLFFGLLLIWTTLVGIWTLNTWRKRQWQTSNLQWILTAVPVLKALVLALSFAFWYSCLHLGTCSFWVAFGVFVTRIFFETACFISFLLISHGYCIMHEQLSISERRSIAGLGSLLYLTLTGYKAAVPQFAILVVLIYLVLLYVIFLHVSRNLALLREQLQLIQNEGVHTMHTALYTKYTMFKKFQAAMLTMVVAEVLMHAKADGVANEYWMRLLVREWTEIGIFSYIGWTFRARETTPFFTVIPTLHSGRESMLPPIYSIEMNEKDFNTLSFKEWHIGVPMSLAKCGGNQKPMLVIVQNPSVSEALENPNPGAATAATAAAALTSPRSSSMDFCSCATGAPSSGHDQEGELLSPESQESISTEKHALVAAASTVALAAADGNSHHHHHFLHKFHGGVHHHHHHHHHHHETEVSSSMMICDHRTYSRGMRNAGSSAGFTNLRFT
ncbi:uncharacterized protein LOC9658269 [Selaginella moellendorffii]|nr:uncharacterized protein LOC9658269 [Selaginella moellendorffii]|eukprot:XP_002962167.2 uncharacterized protein LOC9658269 [Selaginella moellendorffii]